MMSNTLNTQKEQLFHKKLFRMASQRHKRLQGIDWFNASCNRREIIFECQPWFNKSLCEHKRRCAELSVNPWLPTNVLGMTEDQRSSELLDTGFAAWLGQQLLGLYQGSTDPYVPASDDIAIPAIIKELEDFLEHFHDEIAEQEASLHIPPRLPSENLVRAFIKLLKDCCNGQGKSEDYGAELDEYDYIVMNANVLYGIYDYITYYIHGFENCYVNGEIYREARENIDDACKIKSMINFYAMIHIWKENRLGFVNKKFQGKYNKELEILRMINFRDFIIYILVPFWKSYFRDGKAVLFFNVYQIFTTGHFCNSL